MRASTDLPIVDRQLINSNGWQAVAMREDWIWYDDVSAVPSVDSSI